MNNYRIPKRVHSVSDTVNNAPCQFPVGNAKLLELFARNVEIKSWINIELAGLWEGTTAANPWYKNPISRVLRARRRLQAGDTAVLLLDIQMHDKDDFEFTQKTVTSIRLIVKELQSFVENVLVILTPGDEEGGKCYLELNNKLRLTLGSATCRLNPTYEEEIGGSIENESWPKRSKCGVWSTTENETYLQVIMQAESRRRRRAHQKQGMKRIHTNSMDSLQPVNREQSPEGRQVASRYIHRDHYPEPQSLEDRLRREQQDQKETIQSLKAEIEKLNRKLSKRSGAGSERRKLRKMILSIQKKGNTSSSESSDDSTDGSSVKEDCAERNPKEEVL